MDVLLLFPTHCKVSCAKIWELSNVFRFRESWDFTAASIADVWEFVLLLPSSRRRLAPDKRQVTVWSPYRRLTFNETHLRPVCSCLLTQGASQAQSLRGQVFYERPCAVKNGALKERKCRKASDAAPRLMSTAECSLFTDMRFAKSVIYVYGFIGVTRENVSEFARHLRRFVWV